jgi:hypothetical protein
VSFRYASTYVINVGTNLGDPNTWNVRFQDLDLRLNSAESQFSKFDAAVAGLTASGISRLNDNISPLLTAIQANINILDTQANNLNTNIPALEAQLTDQLNTLIASAEATIAQLAALTVVDGGSF